MPRYCVCIIFFLPFCSLHQEPQHAKSPSALPSAPMKYIRNFAFTPQARTSPPSHMDSLLLFMSCTRLMTSVNPSKPTWLRRQSVPFVERQAPSLHVFDQPGCNRRASDCASTLDIKNRQCPRSLVNKHHRDEGAARRPCSSPHRTTRQHAAPR